jgi:hypothetical protein
VVTCPVCGSEEEGLTSRVVQGRELPRDSPTLVFGWRVIQTVVGESPGIESGDIRTLVVDRGITDGATVDSLLEAAGRTGRLTAARIGGGSSRWYPTTGSNPIALLDALLSGCQPGRLDDQISGGFTSRRDVIGYLALADAPRRLFAKALSSLKEGSALASCPCSYDAVTAGRTIWIFGEYPTRVKCGRHARSAGPPHNLCTFCWRGHDRVLTNTACWGPVRFSWRSCGPLCVGTAGDNVRT